TAMHAASVFAVHRRRFARHAGTGLGPAAAACQHRTGIAWMVAHFRFDGSRGSGTKVAADSSKSVMGAVGECESVGADGRVSSDAGPGGVCVTLPPMAWPPSVTDTCCTVTFCSPPVR